MSDAKAGPARGTSLWTSAVDSLIAPSQRLQDPNVQQRARLAAGLTFAMATLLTVGFLLSGQRTSDWPGAVARFGPILVVAFSSYFLTRSRFAAEGALLFVVGFCEVPFLLILANDSLSPGLTLLIFLPLGLILGSFLLTSRALFLSLLLAAAIFLLLPAAGVSLQSEDWFAFASIMAGGIALVIFSSSRTQVERRSLAELTNANEELETLRRKLEARVEERTEALNRRTAQLEAASFVSRQTASILEPSLLLDEVVQLISDRFDFYHAGIFLIDARGQFAVLQAASSEGGKRMLARGHRLEIGREGIVGYAAFQKRARIALDVGEEAVFFSNPDLPQTRSEMALPLIVRGRVIGVLDIQSTRPAAFSNEDVNALQSLADQIGLALDNGRLLAESQSSLRQLQAMTSEGSFRAWQERVMSQHTAFRYTPMGVSPHELRQEAGEPAEDIPENRLVVPISLRGKAIGQIVMARRGRGREWSEHDQSVVADISSQVGLALDNARLLEDLQRRANHDQAIAQAASHFSQTTDLDTLLQLALRELHQLPAVEEVSVAISQPDGVGPAADPRSN